MGCTPPSALVPPPILVEGLGFMVYRGTSPIRNSAPLGPCRRTMPTAPWKSLRGGAVSFERGTPVGLGIRMKGLGCRVSGVGCRVSGCLANPETWEKPQRFGNRSTMERARAWSCHIGETTKTDRARSRRVCPVPTLKTTIHRRFGVL